MTGFQEIVSEKFLIKDVMEKILPTSSYIYNQTSYLFYL